jgi:hypothetical protein
MLLLRYDEFYACPSRNTKLIFIINVSNKPDDAAQLEANGHVH